MASVEATARAGDQWAPANPWSWMLIAVLASGLAFLGTRLLGDELAVARGVLLVLGLVATLAALCLRFQGGIDGGACRLRPGARVALATFTGLVAGAATVLLLMQWNDDAGLPWQFSSVLIFWLLTAPWCAALTACLAGARGGEVSPRIEGSALVLLAGVVCFLTCWALYLGPDREGEWDSMRNLFAGLTLAALVVSPVVAARQGLRRALVSVLILLHFGGILTAIMSTPPGPWVFSYLGTRVYQPYLQFMWLSNAYRFYVPQPTPTSQVWFRAEYLDADGSKLVRWLKLPDLIDEETPDYPLRLQYQRRLALTHNVGGSEPPLQPEKNRLAMQNREWQARERDPLGPPLGAPAPPPLVIGRPIPFQPDMAATQQYMPPDANTRLLVSSYARYVLRERWPEYPNARPQAVKVYRALHRIVDPGPLGHGVDPRAPYLYVPVYLGEYDPAGNLLDERDPLLYWVVPILPDPAEPGVYNAYVFWHAGDERFFKLRGPFGRPNGGPF